MRITRIITPSRFTGLTIAFALFAGVAGGLKAQQTGSAKGGATLLVPPSAPAVPSDRTAMSCPKCKTEVLNPVDWTARGANKPTYLLVRHLCDGCDTTISVQGQGKAKHDVATHKCTSGQKSCCDTTKGS